MRTLLVILAAAAVTAHAQDREPAAERGLIPFRIVQPEEPQSPGLTHCPAAKATVRIAVTDENVHRVLDMRARGASLAEISKIKIHQPYKLILTGVAISPRQVVTIALHPRAKLRVICTLYDGSVVSAKVVGTDPLSNLALIELPVDVMEHLELSTRPVENWDSVQLVGHRKKGCHEVPGAVSRAHCNVKLVDLYCSNGGQPVTLGSSFVVSAPTARLNAGSACVDKDGKLAGIVVGAMPRLERRIEDPEGRMTYYEENFVVPATRIARIVADLRTRGKVVRARYGFQMTPVAEEMYAHFSLPDSASSVVRVEPDSPAAAAGLRRLDVVLALDGKNYLDMYMLGEALTDKVPGKPVTLRLLRGGKKIDISVTPAEKR